MPDSLSFTQFQLPTGQTAWIPGDIELRLPEKSSLDAGSLQTLVYLPWHDRYLGQINAVYRKFFHAVLPYLHVRSTDVHVAACFPFIKELVQAEQEEADERVVSIAFILHDSGWSRMSAAEVARSLGLQGLAFSGEALDPKARHVILSKQIAQRILGWYPFHPPLVKEQKEEVFQAILFHDRPEELAAGGDIPASVKVMCNVDHLWSFTHLSFWEDTVRKGVSPDAHLENLAKDLENYFVSEAGRGKARQLLKARVQEVEAWKSWVNRRS